MPTPGNHGVGSVAPRDSTGIQKGIISQAPSSPPCSRTLPWSKHLLIIDKRFSHMFIASRIEISLQQLNLLFYQRIYQIHIFHNPIKCLSIYFNRMNFQSIKYGLVV